jgi:hypothetical protein
MATDKQIEANRQNSKKAGVKTPEGKAIVRFNAVKHGLRSTALISELSTYKETQEQYEAILEGLVKSFKPRNSHECNLIESMGRALLKMRRYEQLEVGVFCDGEPSVFENHGVRFRILYHLDFELLLKYKASIESQYYRALEALMKSRQWVQMDLFDQTGGGDEDIESNKI